MIGLDTNVILRYLLQDDPAQTRIVNRIFEQGLTESNSGFINLAVVLEIVWVLRSLFRLAPAQIAAHLINLLTTDSLQVQNEQQVFDAAFALQQGTAEFEDALIASLNAWSGCTHTLTFDRKAARLPDFKEIT